ncbi:MAG: type II toxin-antitoxin system HicB family antitoxin [Nitrospirae bacterium]|nr:MAG: type II toxin-antitoxin system HicB family antitoxin [Nitrospirota bacterium]
MSDYVFTIVLEREEGGGYHAFCPALKGCHSQGETLDEAVANIREAIALYVESLREEGKEVPQEELLFRPLRVAV